MALPRKLKFFNLFNEGESYLGQVNEVTLPNLTRKMEDWQGGGMNAPIKADQGMEALTLEFTCGGIMVDVFKQFGITQHDGVKLRFAGSYQRDDGSNTSAVEVFVRGRHSSIDTGNAKQGEASEFKVTSELSYYKLVVDNQTIIEIDIINMIEIVDGVDRLKDHRKALGI
ncbi:MAG: phage major tail tube protein [Oceanospirillaceae bacterium]|nr:phage major tail tube protein [Oceanospirillaceae bacterium]